MSARPGPVPRAAPYALFPDMTTQDPIWRGPIKRSVTIAGHQTSISLEPIFWEALRAHAERIDIPVNALIARIDSERILADEPPNLGSAIRVWLFANR